MADYELVSREPLKLKHSDDGGIKKKKKKKKKLEQKMLDQVSNNNVEEMTSPPQTLYRTKAQQAHDKMQQKRQMQRIIEKASKTHKQRVEEFNNHLDQLTEHYDIPKVSWTK